MREGPDSHRGKQARHAPDRRGVFRDNPKARTEAPAGPEEKFLISFIPLNPFSTRYLICLIRLDLAKLVEVQCPNCYLESKLPFGAVEYKTRELLIPVCPQCGYRFEFEVLASNY